MQSPRRDVVYTCETISFRGQPTQLSESDPGLTNMNKTLLLMAHSPIDSMTNGLANRRARAILIMLANSGIGDFGTDLYMTGTMVGKLVRNGDKDPRIWFNPFCLHWLNTPGQPPRIN
jgi:hypothetical protein